MKAKTFLAFYLSFFVLAFAGIGLYQNMDLPVWLEISHIVVMVGIVGIGIFQGVLVLRGRKNRQPSDDEYSLGILYRAASGSFLLSLYLWASVIYIHAKTEIDAGILFACGILGMAILFALCWLYYKIRGVKNA